MMIRSMLVVTLTALAMSRSGVVSAVGRPPLAAACDPVVWRRAFAQYTTRYPKARAVDLYKFAHHGIMGSEHAVRDTAPVRAWMTRELAQLAAGSIVRTNPVVDPLVEPLPPDGRFVRIHLRPFVQARGNTEALLHAFIATANGAPGDTARFACAESALGTSAAGVLFADQRRKGFPAVHHSPGYEAAYGPAYRVVEAALARTVVPKAESR
jgi:hypothetical protein